MYPFSFSYPSPSIPTLFFIFLFFFLKNYYDNNKDIELKQYWEGVVQLKQHLSLGSMSTTSSAYNSGRYRNP